MSGDPHIACCLSEIAVVDAEPIYRAGIVHTLKTSKLARSIVEGRSAADALQLSRSDGLDALIIDRDLPNGGLETIISIRRMRPSLKVIAVSRRCSLEDVTPVLQCGVQGYLLKNLEPSELIAAVQLIAGGGTYLTPTLAGTLLTQTIAEKRTARPIQPDLTPREDEILAQVSLGATNKEIARKLHITERTVKYFMTSIMHKLHVRNRVEAVLAVQQRDAIGQRSSS